MPDFRVWKQAFRQFLCLHTVSYYIGIIVKANLVHADISVNKVKIGFVHDWTRMIYRRICEMVMRLVRSALSLNYLHAGRIQGCDHFALLLVCSAIIWQDKSSNQQK